MKINVLFYSVMGHTHQMAKAEAEGAEEAGADVGLYRIPETLPEEILKNIPGIEAQQQWGDLPEADHDALREADGLIFGTPTRFGNMCGQMRAFFDSTGPLWMEGALIGKVGSVFTSTASQHGGQ
ncbi:MAG: NAD(P)H:quinone oxidoreductase, partial [Armatimonadota bacterium]